uniref:Cyclin-G-associated kinase n=1 Tax=Panagrellus redivivus TaxID=6233 RepID=A0A7E4V094_PANRE
MADLFRSAFSYIQQAAPLRQTASGSGGSHALVGSTVDVGGFKVKLRALLAEGGYGLVFSAQDSAGQWYALKRLIAADKEAADAALREVRFQKEMSGHPNIVKFVAAASRSPEQTNHGRAEFLLLTELCSGGNLFDYIQRGPLSTENVFKIFYSAVAAVKHMHDRGSPVTHRDIKIENLLFTASGQVKLCDFGSATVEVWRPDDNWNALKRSLLEEEWQKITTPMYRAPEILDTYQNWPIGPGQDTWALGCILFYLCYRTHPFEDSAKLRIINAKYVLPEEKTPYSGFHPLIKSLLQPNPYSRPSVQELCDQLEALTARLNIDVRKPVAGIESTAVPESAPSDFPSPSSYPTSANHEVPSSQNGPAGSSDMFAQLKGQGMSIFKNFKEKSAAVVQTVQTTYGSKGPDITWITSRLIMAPVLENVPETIAQLSEEQLKNYIIETSAKRPFVLFNLSERNLSCDYNRCASEYALPPISSGVAPSLDFMIGLTRNAITFLKRDNRGLVYFTGPEAQCALAVACLLTYCKHSDNAKRTVAAVREFRKGSNFYFPPSYLRIVEVLSTIVSCGRAEELRVMVHNMPVRMNCLYIEPVPAFNNAHTGCRPFAEIYCGGKLSWSTYKNYEDLRQYELKDKSISLNLDGWLVSEDVQIVVYHARWSRMHNRLQKVLMFAVGFHSNFIDGFTDHLNFERDEVDVANDAEELLPRNFKTLLSLQVDQDDRGFRPQRLPEFLTYNGDAVKREWLIGCNDDEHRLLQTFSSAEARVSRAPPPRPPPPGGFDGQSVTLIAPGATEPLDNPFESAGAVQPQNDFFSTLAWDDGGSSSSGHVQAPRAQTDNFFDVSEPAPKPQPSKSNDDALAWERAAGIRVTDEVEDDDADQYKFDYEKKQTPTKPSPPLAQQAQKETDKIVDDLENLLSFGAAPAPPPHQYAAAPKPPTHQSNDFLDDLFSGAAPAPSVPMHRNVSAPVFPDQQKGEKLADPFGDIFKHIPKSAATSQANSGRSTPMASSAGMHPAAAGLPPRETPPMSKPKQATGFTNTNDFFGDLLANHGIAEKKKATMGEMIRTEEEKFMDPVSIQIRNWTHDKNGNIRALLSSLNEVLWEGAGNWNVPSITDMLSDSVVKKSYHRACLLVHPDKQVGKPHHALAQAIFTELNKAMVAFENERK